MREYRDTIRNGLIMGSLLAVSSAFFVINNINGALSQNLTANLPTPTPYLDACSEGGGVDCSILNPDASVTCKDGSKDPSVPFIFAVPQCESELSRLVQGQTDFLETSGCFPPSEMGCISETSYNSVLERLRRNNSQDSELGKNELAECRQQIIEFQEINQKYKACLASKGNPDFTLTGNRLVQPILKSVFCPVFFGYSTYDQVTDTCLCDPGYFMSNGRCMEANRICEAKYGNKAYAVGGNCIVSQPTTTPAPKISTISGPNTSPAIQNPDNDLIRLEPAPVGQDGGSNDANSTETEPDLSKSKGESPKNLIQRIILMLKNWLGLQ